MIEIKYLSEALTRSQEETKSMKAILFDNVILLNNILGWFGVEKMSPFEDTIIAHAIMIRLQVGVLGKHLSTLKTGLVKLNRFERICLHPINHDYSYVMAKLKACNQILNFHPVDHDFSCSEVEATRLIKQLELIGRRVTKEMQLDSPSIE